VLREPFQGFGCYCFQGAVFLEKVGCPRDNGQFLRRLQFFVGQAIQFEYQIIVSTDDEERWRGDSGQRLLCQIRPAASRHDRVNFSPIDAASLRAEAAPVLAPNNPKGRSLNSDAA